MTDNDVLPVYTQLDILKRNLKRNGWVQTTGNIWRHPDAPALYVRTSYMHKEATLIITQVTHPRAVARVISYYRGSRPLAWAGLYFHRVNEKIFAKVADIGNGPE